MTQKFDPLTSERLVRILDRGIERSRSLEAPRALPHRHRTIVEERPSVQLLRLSPEDGAVGNAAERIIQRSEGVTKALAAEAARMDEARSSPKRFTRPVEVENPYGREYRDEAGIRHNRPDKVERIVDTIAWMVQRKHIDRGQEAVARRIEEAWALAPGSLRCTLAPGAGGGVAGSGSPTEGQIWAGEVLNDVRAALGELDAPIVIRICGHGVSLEEVARIVFSVPSTKKVSERETKHVGMRLRMGLAHLARRWRIEVQRGKVVGLRGGMAGHDNQQNFGAMSEAERERFAPLRTAAALRDQRLKGKLRRKRKGKVAGKEGT